MLPSLLQVAPNLVINVHHYQDTQSLVVENGGETYAILASEMMIDILDLAKHSVKLADLISILAKKYPKTKIYGELSALFSQHLLIDASYTLSSSMACFWLQLSLSPVVAQKQLESVSIACLNYSDEQSLTIFKQALIQVGLCLTDSTDTADVIVVLVNDYLQADMKALNQTLQPSKKRWLLVCLSGNQPLLGPVFNHRENDFCYQCLDKRLRENRSMLNTLSKQSPGVEVIKPTFVDSNAITSVSYQFSLELAQYIIFKDNHLSQYIQSFNWKNKQTQQHYVSKIPYCPVCGDVVLDNTPVAFEFDQDAHSVITSGGYKTRSPFVTLNKYQHLVSPISGVVNRLERVSRFDDDWAHVYESGNNIALQSDSLYLTMVSTRMVNAGKGTTREQAKVSALAESIERYCSAFQGYEVRKKAKFTDFDTGAALLPNVFMHYSDTQFEQANQINTGESHFYSVPGRIDVDKYYEWSPIWSLLEHKHIWVPTQLLYFGYPYGEHWIASADTNGTASGNSKTEAFVQAFLELIERDNIAIWWQNRLNYQAVDLSSFADEHIRQAVEIHQKRYHRKLWAIDISTDTKIPTFVVISYRQDDVKNQEICFAASSHFDANIAMLRAVCEHTQLLEMIRYNRVGNEYRQLSYEFSQWLKEAKIEKKDYQFLTPSTEKIATFSDYNQFNCTTIQTQKSACLDLVKSNNWDIYVADLTRIDIGMPVIKVMIPELRSMHTRLDAGRLYDVPVVIGKLKQPLAESELNPITIFI